MLSFRGLRRTVKMVKLLPDDPTILVPVKVKALFFAPAPGKQIGKVHVEATVVDSTQEQINLLHLGLVPVSVASDRTLTTSLSYSGEMWHFNGRPLKKGQVLVVTLDE